jgi:hypothetical protein
MESLNIYGDSSAGELSGYGIDISLQRTDSLDIALLDEVKASQFKNLKVVDLGCGKGGQAVRLGVFGLLCSCCRCSRLLKGNSGKLQEKQDSQR